MDGHSIANGIIEIVPGQLYSDILNKGEMLLSKLQFSLITVSFQTGFNWIFSSSIG